MLSMHYAVLAHLVNSSFISGIFPEKLKISKIIPVFKKGEVLDKTNYRPISLLPAFSKIFEKAVHVRLYSYLETHNFLDNVQHGYRSGKSVTTAAASFVDSILESIDKGECVIGLFMDMTKAFDCVVLLLLLIILHEI